MREFKVVAGSRCDPARRGDVRKIILLGVRSLPVFAFTRTSIASKVKGFAMVRTAPRTSE
jgi:hypothetical protein